MSRALHRKGKWRIGARPLAFPADINDSHPLLRSEKESKIEQRWYIHVTTIWREGMKQLISFI